MHGNHRFRLSPGTGIQQGCHDWFDGGQNGLPGLDLITGLERDAAHFPGNRGGDNVAVSHTGLPFLGNAHRQRPAGDRAGFDDDGLRPQAPSDQTQQHQPAKPWRQAPGEVAPDWLCLISQGAVAAGVSLSGMAMDSLAF